MRLFIYILSVLVFIEADDNVSEPRETVNPTTPIHNVSEPRETVNPTTPIRTKRSAESSKLGEISPAIFHAQEVRTAEGTKNIINSFSTPGGTHFQYEIEGTPVGGESSEQRRARKKANTQRVTIVVEIEPLPAANAVPSVSVDRTQVAAVAVAICYTTFVVNFAAHVHAAFIARFVDLALGVLRIYDLWLTTRQNLLLGFLTWASGGPSSSSGFSTN